MSVDKLVDQLRRTVDKGVQQARKTAETMEAEARLFALQRKVGLRVYQLWRAGQLTHSDLEADLEQMALLEAKIDQADTADDLGETRVSPGSGACRGCSEPLPAGARFCTHCGACQQ